MPGLQQNDYKSRHYEFFVMQWALNKLPLASPVVYDVMEEMQAAK
jgi:hypothetical protein